MRRVRSIVWLLLVCAACACDGGDAGEEDLAERGRKAYVANCIACHNLDPSREGVMGPAIAGSSPALLAARVLRAEYPDGYTPKRDTSLMQPLPYLAGDIESLAEYLRGN